MFISLVFYCDYKKAPYGRLFDYHVVSLSDFLTFLVKIYIRFCN